MELDDTDSSLFARPTAACPSQVQVSVVSAKDD
jgi:hypothetical protein